MEYAIMFNSLEGGVVEPIEWNKDNLQPDRSIIILDESSFSLFLWHGAKQGLVARRTALRQADSLKGHGYSIGKTIIGRDIKYVKEIDYRKVGKDPETDNLYKELAEILSKEFMIVENHIITFQVSELEAAKAELKKGIRPKPISKAEPKPTVVEVPEEEEKPIKEAKTVKKTGEFDVWKEETEPKVLKVETRGDIKFEKLTSRLEGIESKLDILITEFMEWKASSFKPEKTSKFVQNVRTMKNLIEQGKSASDAPEYPTRDDYIKKKLDEKKEGL
jgi:hypothetical protein